MVQVATIVHWAALGNGGECCQPRKGCEHSSLPWFVCRLFVVRRSRVVQKAIALVVDTDDIAAAAAGAAVMESRYGKTEANIELSDDSSEGEGRGAKGPAGVIGEEFSSDSDENGSVGGIPGGLLTGEILTLKLGDTTAPEPKQPKQRVGLQAVRSS